MGLDDKNIVGIDIWIIVKMSNNNNIIYICIIIIIGIVF